ncbi:MAG: N-6 DNA methylase [Ginsengibacter sp.]
MASIASESKIEYGFIGKLTDLKYTYRSDIRDRNAFEQNFRKKFDSLNRVHLTDTEFARLKEKIINPDLFAILVLKKCKKFDDVLFINASEHFEKGKRQNSFRPQDIEKVVETYQERKEEERYSRRVSMEEIEKNDYNLNLSRYVSTAVEEEAVDLNAVHSELIEMEKKIADARERHNGFLRQLRLEGV